MAISVLRNGHVLVDTGPLTMTLQAYRDGEIYAEGAMRGAHEALQEFEQLARAKEEARKNILLYEKIDHYPRVLQAMIQSCRRTKDPTLTPMAAVAGTLSDIAADAIFDTEATKVIVNNGGDIAIRLSHGQSIKVGLRSDIRSARIDYIISIADGLGVGGVATSGLGGRSFTKGIASSATVLAGDASYADACATVIANSTDIPSPKIHRQLAEVFDPDTDIRGHWVTVAVDPLSPEEIDHSLDQGVRRAREMDILGAILVVQNQLKIYPDSLADRVTRIH